MKTIFFDFDGVIHDTFDMGRGILQIASGREYSEERFKDFFDGNVFEHWDVVSEEEDAKFYALQKEAFDLLRIDEDIKRNLEKLATSHTLFIVSSNQEENLNTYFQNNNFINIFKEILGAESHKSKVEKFNYLFQKYNLKSEDCIFVTDTLGDILEGNKVGLRTIAVDFGFHERERLEKGNPYKIVSNFEDVLAAINEM